MPVADAYVSKHPFRPQLHFLSLSYSTVICPSSPPDPLYPSNILSFITIPPPIPVPIVTRIILPCSFPPPIHSSPTAAALASFTVTAFNPVSFSIIPETSTLFSQCRFTQCLTMPSATGPGTPIPMPTILFISTSVSLISFLTVSAVSLNTYAQLSSCLVGISVFVMIFPFS